MKLSRNPSQLSTDSNLNNNQNNNNQNANSNQVHRKSSATALDGNNDPEREDTLDKLVARVNFYESSVEQLKKELPKYLNHRSEMDKTHQAFSKVIKSVAASEPHNLLQYFFFNYAQKEEELSALHQQTYADLLSETNETLESWSKKLILPMRNVMEDHVNYQKTLPTIHANDPTFQPPASSSAGKSGGEDPYAANTLLLKSLLPVHAKLFEKHRLQEFQSFFKYLLRKEITYHAAALESYSQLLECLSEIEEQEMANWNRYYSLPSQSQAIPPAPPAPHMK